MAISSGARGTAGQQQDRRNAADRAGTGGGSRGTQGQQQDRRNATSAQRAGNVAPGVGRSFSPNDRPTNMPFGGMPAFQPRRAVNPTPSYDMTPGNMAKLAGMAGATMLGGGPLTAMGMMGRPLGAAMGPAVAGLTGFEGYRGAVNAPGDYDPQNRLGTADSGFLQQQMAQYQRPMMQRPAMPTAAQQRPMSPYGQAPGQQLSSGLQGYGSFRPGYSFINGPFR